MRSRMAGYVTQIFTALLLTGCTQCQATVKYQPGDTNVAPGQTLQWSFDRDPDGALPAGAQAFGGKWEVRAEADAPSRPNALCQTGTAQYPALSLGDRIFADVVVSTGFKPVSGSEDRAAGIIFRIQDRDNYYILRANALEDNVNIYKYAGGRRSVIQEGSAKVPSGTWQELRVEVKGNTIRGFLNGKLVVEARDDTFRAGKVGLWTKADSVTCFDNVKATAE
ncbi:MAG TPA: family 16 glycoside hydrolase [Geobacteraceae bacterium]